MTFEIRIRTKASPSGDDVTLAYGECHRDALKEQMVLAIEAVFNRTASVGPCVIIKELTPGNPGVMGRLTLWAWCGKEWASSLRDVLEEAAAWDFRTLSGYGQSIDRLVQLKNLPAGQPPFLE